MILRRSGIIIAYIKKRSSKRPEKIKKGRNKKRKIKSVTAFLFEISESLEDLSIIP